MGAFHSRDELYIHPLGILSILNCGICVRTVHSDGQGKNETMPTIVAMCLFGGYNYAATETS